MERKKNMLTRYTKNSLSILTCPSKLFSFLFMKILTTKLSKL